MALRRFPALDEIAPPWPGNAEWGASLALLAFLTWPGDADAWERLRATARVEATQKGQRLQPTSPPPPGADPEAWQDAWREVRNAVCAGGMVQIMAEGEIARVTDSPAMASMLKQALEAYPGWCATGLLLVLIHSMQTRHRRDVRSASRLRAEYVLQNWPASAGGPPMRTERTIRDAWERYKPVAHIAAAVAMLKWSAGPDADAFRIIMERPLDVLSLARRYQDFGIKHCQKHGSKEELLPRATTILVPKAYQRPSPQISHDLPGELIDVAKQYKAQLSHYFYSNSRK